MVRVLMLRKFNWSLNCYDIATWRFSTRQQESLIDCVRRTLVCRAWSQGPLILEALTSTHDKLKFVGHRVFEVRLSRNCVSPYAPEKAPLLRGRKTSTLRLDVQNARD